MSDSEVRDGSSIGELVLAKLGAELERISSLYESLAVRMANLEANLQPVGTQEHRHAAQNFDKADTQFNKASAKLGNSNTTWFRILRHMAPHKIRLLLAEHDVLGHARDAAVQERQQLAAQREALENQLSAQRDLLARAQSEVLRYGEMVLHERRRQNRPRLIRSHNDTIVSLDMPEFPKAIFCPDVRSKIKIIDVGAQDLVSEDHIYAPLQRAGATDIVGFEPLDNPHSGVRRADTSVKILKKFIGAGGAATFHITQFDPASSLLTPNAAFLSKFVALPTMCETVSRVDVQTTRLDDVDELDGCDYLKVDVQGGELDVLRGAQRLLENVITIHCEVEFGAVYQGQPLFAEIDSFLRANGFEMIDLVNAGYNRYEALPGQPDTGSRLMWAEAIYFKLFDKLAAQDNEKLLKAAFIAHVNYSMHDLAAYFLTEYDKATGKTMHSVYLAELAAWQNLPV
jgi:FkbM family methyltransferase